MYNRNIEEMPDSIINNYKANFGTFKGHPKMLDIRGIYKPYGTLPLPTNITNLGIKSRITYYFNTGDFVGFILFFDAKVFNYCELLYWNVQTQQKYIYKFPLGMKFQFIPHNLNSAYTACKTGKNYLRLSWDRSTKKFSFIFNTKGRNGRNDSQGAFSASFDNPCFTELTSVIPCPTYKRCSAYYDSCLPIKGSITTHSVSQDRSSISSFDEGISFFEMKRSYMKFKSHSECVVGLGFVNGKKISFRIESQLNDLASSEKLNANILFYDGKEYPLPPVLITHPYGTNKKWIIQDTDNMVDMVFNPVAQNNSSYNLFIVNTIYNTHFGTFEGTLLTQDGQKISFKALNGISENYLIRM